MKMRSYLGLGMRPLNCALVCAGICAGYYVATPAVFLENFWKLMIALISGFLITAGGNISNDYFDVTIDKKIHPERPFVSGTSLNLEYLELAKRRFICLFLSGVLISYIVNFICFVLALINTLILISYNISLKKKIFGNFLIAYLASSVFLYGSAISGNMDSLIIWVLFWMSFLATASREIVKDIEDKKGDLEQGRKSLPIVIGEKKARVTAIILMSGGLSISPLPYFLRPTVFYLLAIIIADSIFILALAMISNPTLSSRLMKTGMAVALVAFLGVR